MTIETYKKQLIDRLDITNDDIVLDYGCGKGDFINIILSKKLSPRSIYAIDSAQTMIDHIHKRFPQEIASSLIIPKVCNDPQQLSGLEFNKIICHNVLECIEDKENFINNLYVLLAKNGILLLSHLDFDSAIYNSDHKDLTRQLIHHFADTQQPWQKNSDGQIGRKIPGLIKNSLCKNYTIETYRIVETEFKPSNYGYLMADMLCEISKDKFSPHDLKLWREDLEKKDNQNEHYFAIDLVTAMLEKQGPNKT